MHGSSSSESDKSSEEKSATRNEEMRQKIATASEIEEDKAKTRDKKWEDDDTMQWIKREEGQGHRRQTVPTVEKRKPTQNTNNVRERPGASGRGRSRSR